MSGIRRHFVRSNKRICSSRAWIATANAVPFTCNGKVQQKTKLRESYAGRHSWHGAAWMPVCDRANCVGLRCCDPPRTKENVQWMTSGSAGNLNRQSLVGFTTQDNNWYDHFSFGTFKCHAWPGWLCLSVVCRLPYWTGRQQKQQSTDGEPQWTGRLSRSRKRI